MRTGLAAAIMAMGVGGVAHADEFLGAGAIYGSTAQARGVCYFYNAGTTFIQVKSPRIATINDVAETLVIDDCANLFSGNLPPGRVCGIAANISNNSAYSCRARIGPDKLNARGVFELRTTAEVVLQNVELE